MKRGYDLPKEFQKPGEIPVMGSAGQNGFHNEAKVKGIGVVIGRSGNSFGEIHLCKTDFWAHNTAMYINDFKGNDPKFVFYFLKNLDFKNYNSGSAQPSLNRNFLYPITVKIPPLPAQQKIASILSAYDDLIENNLKRIKLLEEAAQHLYREWFVKFRFPGWEAVRVVDGLPVGWERKSVNEVVRVNPTTKIEVDKLAPFVPMTSLSENSMVISPIEEREPKGGARFINKDTLFARITPCLENGKTGFVQFMEDDSQVATGSTEFIVLRETEKIGAYFIYCLARQYDFRENAIKSMSGSDGRQRVKSEAFDKYLLAVPSKNIKETFERTVEPFFKEIQILTKQNQRLKEGRDLLLPRLMNQSIEV